MIVNVKHRMVILSMPKCASTALVRAMQPHADIVISNPPGLKHTNFRKYNRHLKKYLQSVTKEEIETACLFREPVDWLNSWWRYRQRPALSGHANSTKGLSFDAFAGRYLDGVSPGDTVGRQSRFVVDGDGRVGVDHLFRYDRLDHLVAWIEERTGWTLSLDQVNVSPSEGERALSAGMLARLQQELTLDFEIYEGLRGGGATSG